MRPERTDQLLESTPRGVDVTVTDPAGDRARSPGRSTDPADARADDARRMEAQSASKHHRQRKLLRGSSSARKKARRLGPLEYWLLALIALGIAITVAMAIANPSG
jgi:hypothetical protein